MIGRFIDMIGIRYSGIKLKSHNVSILHGQNIYNHTKFLLNYFQRFFSLLILSTLIEIAYLMTKINIRDGIIFEFNNC